MISDIFKKRGKKKGIAKAGRKSVKMEAAKPFSRGKKKSEPDDRPRPMAPGSANKNPTSKKNEAREKRLKGILI